jgi:hypothetical protein
MIGDPRVIPGGMLQIDKISNGVDGGYRVDQARHEFSKHGYFIDFKCTRITKKTASSKAAQKAAQQQAQAAKAAEAEQDKADAQKERERSNKKDVQAQAQALKEASKNGAPLCEECDKARKDDSSKSKAAAA